MLVGCHYEFLSGVRRYQEDVSSNSYQEFDAIRKSRLAGTVERFTLRYCSPGSAFSPIASLCPDSIVSSIAPIAVYPIPDSVHMFQIAPFPR